ncbi:MAG TPA: hypothetical protein GXX54_07870 [Clostridiales bacterium]|nr:hypothetical protein [Clostridiales bacterium]
MKVICLSKRNLILPIILAFVLITALINIAGYLLDFPYISVIAAASQAEKYEIRSRLLMEAMDMVGACEPKTAAEIWASGLVKRSAALQYSVMAKELKAEYARQLEETAPNWVTGVSSPWVDSYKILNIKDSNQNQKTIEIEFALATSTGPAGEYNATLYLTQDGEFWRISNLSFDGELFPYIGFNPPKR